MLPLPSGRPHEQRRRPLRSARVPRFTVRRGVGILAVGLCFFLFIRWTNQSNIECVSIPNDLPVTQDTTYTHPSSHITYQAIQDPLAPGASRNAVRPHTGPFVAGDVLPSECLDSHFESGALCHTSTPPVIDFIWTWVNSTDPLVSRTIGRMLYDLHHESELGRPLEAMDPVKQNQYRDHGELRYSLRSVLDFYATAQSQNFHLVVTDLPAAQCDKKKDSAVRLVQLPQWLDFSRMHSWRNGTVSLKTWYHAQLFPEYKHSIFHSLAIETVIDSIPGLSDNFVYMNDDLFFLAPLRAADFYTNAFGPVLKMQSDLMVKPHRDGVRASTEWQALEHSNSLLSDRFGARYRPYMVHQAKVLGKSLLTEIKLIWADDFATTASRPFRGMSLGEGDTYLAFLYSHYIIERHREILLWSWLVARLGSASAVSGMWTEELAHRAWKEIGGEKGVNAFRPLKNKDRETLSETRLRKVFSEESQDGAGTQKLKSKYVFSSEDGYPFTGFGRRGAIEWLPPPGKNDPGAWCQIKFDDCFAWERDGEPVSLDGAFKRIAFDRPVHCGDCIMTGLVAQSGRLGLSAFLPPPNTMVKPDPSKAKISPKEHERRIAEVPMLPMTLRWWLTDYSMDSVLAPYVAASAQSHEIDLRQWTLQALQRYRFVIGETPSKFISISNPSIARRELERVSFRESKSPLAMLCLNDDVGYGDWKVRELMDDFMSETWPRKAEWET